MNTPNMIPGRALTDYLYNKASHLRVPLSGTFELSPVCNFSCRMCYVRKTQQEVRESPRPILTLNDWRRIAREAREAGMLYLLLTGGEPLLWPDFWTLYDELIDMGFLISINTNGSLIAEAAIAHFRQKPPLRINITLYGASDETYQNLCGASGVFTKVDNAIRGLLDAGITVKLNCSLTPQNAADLDWIIDYAKARNTIVSVATYMFPPVRRDPTRFGENERFTPEECAKYMLRFLERDRGPKAYEAYLHSILSGYIDPPGLDEGCIDPIDGKIRCRAGKASFWISWDGWLMPCGMMPEPKVDITKLPFGEAWASLAEASAALRLSGVCDKCSNLKVCHPCAAISYAETGSSAGIPTYMCRTTREMCRIARETLSSDKP
ncbi:MAG: radical SAM protein [Oscillospiraceae bacterium]|nr:radical SAM protein [Oscillospiraceae bacterium]